jgi:dTDP-4-amino-4,6-dideoxygalactose transaminase
LHMQEAYSELGYKAGDFPVAEKVANEIMSLPMFPHITKEQIETVVRALKESL